MRFSSDSPSIGRPQTSTWQKLKYSLAVITGIGLGVGGNQTITWLNTPNPNRVVSVHDGDTVTIKIMADKQLRIYGADMLELKQPLGDEAQAFLKQQVEGRVVSYHRKSSNYGRWVCEIQVNGQDLGDLMVKNGYGFDDPKYGDGRYKAAEAEAKKFKRGVWGKFPDGGERPWEFRARNKSQ